MHEEKLKIKHINKIRKILENDIYRTGELLEFGDSFKIQHDANEDTLTIGYKIGGEWKDIVYNDSVDSEKALKVLEGSGANFQLIKHLHSTLASSSKER